MPPNIYGTISGREDVLLMKNQKIDYSYPNDLDLSPDSKLHAKLLDMILEKASLSSSTMCVRYPSWEKMDKSLTGYKKASEEEQKIKMLDEDKPISIVFPYSYAILETLVSYMMSAFFIEPVFRYEGYEPNDVIGSILLEKIINLHSIKNKIILNLHTMHRDSFIYGFGAVHPYWTYGKNFSGNALLNIDPYKYLPDVNVPLHEPQKGEFVAWTSDTNYVTLLNEEYENSDLFNVKYLKTLKYKGTSIYDVDNSGRYFRSMQSSKNDNLTDVVTEIKMYIKLIPSDHGLGDSDRPEIWYFRVAADSVIITAREAGFKDNKFPIVVAVPDFDGYSSAPIGRLEMLYGMQETLDFFINSHIANVRKAVNNTLIYDPKVIDGNDLKASKAGGMVRVRREWWGKGAVKDAVHQLQINDVTRAHIADSGFFINSMQTLMGTDDVTMGTLRQGGPERLTKAEFQGTVGGKISRLERIARIVGVQAYQDIGNFFANNTQQLMDDDIFIKVAGEWETILLEEFDSQINRGRLQISPEMIDVNYDVIIRDGSIPGGNYSDSWIRLFDILSKQPELAQQFDMVRIFKYIARNEGAKNINDFVMKRQPMPNIPEMQNIQAQTLPENVIQNQVNAGNLVPIQ